MSLTTNEGAIAALRGAMYGAAQPLAGAVTAVKTAREGLALADSITDAITSSAALILAVEGLQDAAKAAADQARDGLRDAMSDAGCYNLGGEALTVALADAPRTVTITDRAALLAARPELFTTPEPAPDRKRIADELRAGRSVAGAALSNGGGPVLRITTRKKS